MSIQQIQNNFLEIQTMYSAGQISKEEYKNLLEGLEVEKTITYNAEEMQQKEQLNKIISHTLNALSLVA